MSTNKIVANALKAMNGAYDTLIIRKDSKYNNLWCIYQDGSTNRAIPRVFDSPDTAKRYIQEYLPAWGDAKIKVKNSVVTNADPNADALVNKMRAEGAALEKKASAKISAALAELSNGYDQLYKKFSKGVTDRSVLSKLQGLTEYDTADVVSAAW